MLPYSRVNTTTTQPPKKARTHGLGSSLGRPCAALCSTKQNRCTTTAQASASSTTRTTMAGSNAGASTAKRVGVTPIS